MRASNNLCFVNSKNLLVTFGERMAIKANKIKVLIARVK